MRSTSMTPKKATNVSLSEDVLREARDLRINVSQAAEAGLIQEISAKRAEKWLTENKDALDDYNRYVREHGLILGKYRTF